MVHHLVSCFYKPRRKSSISDKNSVEKELTPDDSPSPVIVELFSSQGCPESFAAEMLLSRLGRGDYKLKVPMILLAYHVDYWDFKGWKDPFGSSLFTVRQKDYVEGLNLDSLFTPLFVVQGRVHCVGGGEDEDLFDCIESASRFPSPSFQVKFEKTTPDTLQVSLNGTLKCEADANIMVALYECGIVTSCLDGANKDKVLANDYVVRKLEKLCAAKDVPFGKKTTPLTINFALWEGFKASKCGVVVFVETSSHQIFGSQKFQLPDDF